MSKRGYLSRYLLILRKLKQKPYSSFEELQNHISNNIEFLLVNDDSLNIGFSKRTLQRDIQEMRNLYCIQIEYSKSHRGYFISQNEVENMYFQRMLEAFDMFNSLNLSRDLTLFFHLEPRRSQGTENLQGLIHAIRNKFEIKFSYQKFWENEETSRIAEPYALKEFKNRWYIIAREGKDKKIKIFALDRLTNLQLTNRIFERSSSINLEEFYKYCFGIIAPTHEEPQEIILSFSQEQGKYIQSLPLHTTQQVLVDDSTEFRIKLKLYITHDLIMEILSYGPNVKVLQPVSLMESVRNEHKKAFEQYNLGNGKQD
jgi:predicted DNA-binding transcriptional regulator YafY